MSVTAAATDPVLAVAASAGAAGEAGIAGSIIVILQNVAGGTGVRAAIGGGTTVGTTVRAGGDLTVAAHQNTDDPALAVAPDRSAAWHTSDTWVAGTAYRTGRIVSGHAGQYVATRTLTTSTDLPGSWRRVATWDADGEYATGTVVDYLGTAYRALTDVVGAPVLDDGTIVTPDVDVEEWQALAASDAWAAASAYAAGDLVTDGGAIYQAAIAIAAATDAPSDWASIQEWTRGGAYASGDLVTYDGMVYRAIADIGESDAGPRLATADWQRADAWTAGGSYAAGQVVFFDDGFYRAKVAVDGSTTTPDADVARWAPIAAWASGSHYAQGALVAFGDIAFRAVDALDGTTAQKIQLYAGGLAFGGTAGVGLAAAVLVRTMPVTASIASDDDVSSAADLLVDARQHQDLTSIAMAGAVGGEVGAAGSTTVLVLTDTTAASIGDRTLVNCVGTTCTDPSAHPTQTVQVTAADTSTIVGAAGMLAAGGTAGVGAGADVKAITKNTTATIGAAAHVQAAGDIVVAATSSEDILSISVGGAIGGEGSGRAERRCSGHHRDHRREPGGGRHHPGGRQRHRLGERGDDPRHRGRQHRAGRHGGRRRRGRRADRHQEHHRHDRRRGRRHRARAVGIDHTLHRRRRIHAGHRGRPHVQPASSRHTGTDRQPRPRTRRLHDQPRLPARLLQRAAGRLRRRRWSSIGGLRAGYTYYVIVVSSTEIQLSQAPRGPPLHLTIPASGRMGQAQRFVATSKAGTPITQGSKIVPVFTPAVDVTGRQIVLPYLLDAVTGDQVVYSAGGDTPIAGLVDGHTYYVIVVSGPTGTMGQTISLADTKCHATGAAEDCNGDNVARSPWHWMSPA
ncbi:hypothetical protein [Microbacterium elymi]|uniref:Chitin-binding type-3 domain-containing protein n=1 Tax=Microbacterium elymi TaxID=2909587 RepID=A0ABY5NL18_9MICO|nr:hypothetical protein [Microbacterium elymi]UUT35878.1 hypothetical protein L2X98_22230 [Microbacterium elymi]